MREELSEKKSIVYGIVGVISLLAIWVLISLSGIVSKSILPYLWDVVGSYEELITTDHLIGNLFYSLKLNILGYLIAVLISIPLGFWIGLSSTMHGLYYKPVNSIRFIPLTAITGLFITWFGIDDTMKIAFLAFGIIVYLLPTTIERIREVDQIYVDTAKTLGANSWQIIRHVFIPATLSKLFDDIRILTAISWTYIIIAELLNRTGGIGAIMYLAGRQSRTDKVFAGLFLIIFVGIVQDKVFALLDKLIFPDKYKRSAK